ncbi:hypothetical protein JW935_06045 [candidate division KSB1 bacterium]|nr:hypothetical protein [candidate division KSB1 bacterium]
MNLKIDKMKEQEATLARPVRHCGIFAKLLFGGMDFIHGKKLTYPKIRLLELLARIPYQAWEVRQYRRLNCKYEKDSVVGEAKDIIQWGRAAQDNEFWHLEVIGEKIRQDGVKLKWFRDRFLPPIAAFSYNLFSRFLAWVNIQAAFKLNADFEDHAEHEYFTFVQQNPELENQPINAEVVTKYGDFNNWADVFRRIALDERDHMNNSLLRCGRAKEVVKYLQEK